MKIGIDIGGSHIGIGLVNSNGTIILKEEKFIKEKSNFQFRKFLPVYSNTVTTVLRKK